MVTGVTRPAFPTTVVTGSRRLEEDAHPRCLRIFGTRGATYVFSGTPGLRRLPTLPLLLVCPVVQPSVSSIIRCYGGFDSYQLDAQDDGRNALC